MKKFLAILLSVVMLLGCVVISTAAEAPADRETFEIGAGVNSIQLYHENVEATLGNVAILTDCDYGKTYSEVRTGDKFEFVIDVETAGTYYFSMTYAWAADTAFSVSVDGGAAVNIACPATGGWQSPIKSGPSSAIELDAGQHNIVLTLTGAGINMVFAANICDSANAEIVHPIWRYAANAMPGAATGAKGADGKTVAYHANVLQAFDGFYFSMATWSQSDAYCKLAVYNWVDNYDTTLAGEPIATAAFNPMADNTANGIDFDEALPAGEYLFYIYDTSAAHCGIYCYEGADEKGVTYVDGVVDSTWIPSLGIKINAGFGEGTEILGVASPEVETPVEPEYSEDQTVSLDKGIAIYAIDCPTTNWTPTAWPHGSAYVDRYLRPTVGQVHSNGVEYYWEYTVYVAEAGEYDLATTTIWPSADTRMAYTVDGGERLGGTNSNAGYFLFDIYATSPVTVTLSEGAHTIRAILIDNAIGGIYSFTVSPNGKAPIVPVSVERHQENAWHHFALHFAYRAIVNHSFDEFGFHVINANMDPAARTGAVVSVYKWNGNVDATLAGQALASGISTAAWDEYLRLELEEDLPAGEYFFVLTPAEGVIMPLVDVYADANNTAFSGYTYIDGIETKYEPGMVINFTTVGTSSEHFGTCAPQIGFDQSPVVGGAELGLSGEYNVWDSYALHIAPNTSFDSLKIFMATYGMTNMHAIFSIYEWDCCYECTLKGKALVTEDKLLADNSFQTLAFEALPAGEYLLVINGVYFAGVGSGAPLVFAYKTNTAFEGDVYYGGKLVDNPYAPEVYLHFTEIVDDFYAEPTADAAEVAYVYVNSLDGNIVYSGNAPLTEVDEATLAKLNAYANGTYNKFVEFEEVSYENHVYTFYSVHNTEADVTVNGGEAEEKDGYYILTAGAPEEGQYFAGWYIGDVLLSYSETFKFFPNVATADLVAKYDTEAPAKNSDVGVKVDRTNDKLTVSVFPIYGDNAIVEFGYYVATSIQDMTAEAVIAAGKKLDSHAPHAYMVRVHDITEATQYKHIYVVGYYTYVDGNGDTQTGYTGVYAADSLATKVIIDSDTYTYVNNNQWILNPETVSGVEGFEGNVLHFYDSDKGGTVIGFNDGSYEMVKFAFEEGATYSLSFEYKAGEAWIMNSGDFGIMPCFIQGRDLFYWRADDNIEAQFAALTSELVCIDEENDIWRYTVTFASTQDGGSLELGQWHTAFEVYMDNIILEKIA